LAEEDSGEEELKKERQRDTAIYFLAGLFGLGAGLLDLVAGDLMLTAIYVLGTTMLLGALWPAKPWRWTLAVGLFVPLVQLLAYFVFGRKPYRAQIYESFLGLLTGIAGAYGGSMGRRGLNELFDRKSN
jgi:hypothetical protein